MSIAVMGEGDVMGRGVPPNRKMEATVRARLRNVAPDMVAVLGSGPSGLLAAHAVALAGKTPVVISAPGPDGAPIRSEIGPATYLHRPIPDLTGPEPDGMIRFIKVGTAQGYAAKVYGNRDHSTSWEKFDEGEQPAWNLSPRYDELWRRYYDQIIPMAVGAEMVGEFLDEFGAVVSTIPGYAICEHDGDTHSFPFRTVWTTDQFTFHDDRDPIMVYDGHEEAPGSWGRFRSSRIFGKVSTEYANRVPGAQVGVKVLPTNCDCHPEVVRAGRWGEWKPGVLVHHAFEKVWGLMFDNFEGS
jgi:hypothetical protein